ncbi:unnamed protein product [Bursaphelenchus okinawaensis]|uniref:Sulfatase domain-containing protein n=1 Tax=Bursaphelenchus okinawaensis TaxID=465554 RepID=A0A811KSZ3_9BILA|nr:unnamed protein product [Bursaphelenchus okinawaensis]CAG9112136.1 unnamed protein product [Bursaphelenchus okinawaensis]
MQTTSNLSTYNLSYFTATSSKSISDDKSQKLLSKIESTICRLPDLDPWDDKAKKFIDKSLNEMDGCEVKFEFITKLINGRVVLDRDEEQNATKCAFRCFYSKNDYEFTYGTIYDISVRPDCDVLEVNCTKEYVNRSPYSVLHTQIYRKDIPPLPSPTVQPNVSTTTPPDKIDVRLPQKTSSKPTVPQKPDVHLLILDSVSSTQLMRSMSATVNFLRNEMDAIIFPYLNKVGINSMPNAYAMLMGRQIYEVKQSPVTNIQKPELNSTEYCNKYLDDEQFIGFEFKRKGYKTMWSEDWDMGAFNWLACKGFLRPPVDHYMRPFQLQLEKQKPFTINKTLPSFELQMKTSNSSTLQKDRMYKDLCKEPHEYQMDYLQKFIDAYQDKPKFSITWSAYLAHDDTNALYHVDLYYKKFFRRNREKFSNSFIFIMGDHGNRYDKIRATKLGEAEEKNPALLLTLPEHLRENKAIKDSISKNTLQLTTHFDTYATLVDIAHNNYSTTSTTSNSTKPHRPSHLDIIGESYLHPYNLSKPRNCNNQRISFDYCNCQFKESLVNNTDLINNISKFVLTTVNEAIARHNYSDVCSILELAKNHKPEVYEFEPKINFDTYKVTVKVEPSGGLLWGYVKAVDGVGVLSVIDGGPPIPMKVLLNLAKSSPLTAAKTAAKRVKSIKNLISTAVATVISNSFYW